LKILVISQYFWPENFRVNDLCLELQNRGYNVSVLTGKPNYPRGKFMTGYSFFNKRKESYNGIKVFRTPLIPRGNGEGINLILNYFSFALFACLRIFFILEKFDRIIVYQLSPATVGFPGILAKWKFKAKLYFYIQDLWPESLVDAGGLNSKIILNIINSMLNLFYKKSSQIWVQSTGFIKYLERKGVEKSKIKFLPNTVESFYKPEVAKEKYKAYFPSGFNIVFAGNLGIAQDFDSIILASEILKRNNISINWVILGEGRDKAKIIEKIYKRNVVKQFHFLGSFPSSEMPFFFACADALLVSLKSTDIFSLTIPSKLQSYLACGKPIIGNIDGVVASIINESNSGVCSSSGDFVNLAKNVEVLVNITLTERNQYGINAYNFFQNNYHRNIVYDKLEEYLK
jgi:glycosyltransferase involved in cell wall biosynthesis